MFEQLIEYFQYTMIQRAVIAGTFISVCCAFLGVFLVLRRFSMIGDGLSHVAFGAVGLGLLAGVTPLYMAIPVVMLASLFILKLCNKSGINGDAAIGLVSSLGVATGVILASKGGGFNVDLFSYLFGNILAISKHEVLMSIALSLIIIGVIVFFFHDFFATSFEEEYAQTLGIKTGFINSLLAICTGLTVVLGIRIVGAMLVSSLIVFPAITALQLARGFRGVIITAVVLSMASVLIGIILSFILELPSGATIVMVNFAFFIPAFFIGKFLR